MLDTAISIKGGDNNINWILPQKKKIQNTTQKFFGNSYSAIRISLTFGSSIVEKIYTYLHLYIINVFTRTCVNVCISFFVVFKYANFLNVWWRPLCFAYLNFVSSTKIIFFYWGKDGEKAGLVSGPKMIHFYSIVRLESYRKLIRGIFVDTVLIWRFSMKCTLCPSRRWIINRKKWWIFFVPSSLFTIG